MPAEKISLDEKVPCTKRLALDEKGFDMICNNNFNAALQHSGLSMYALSKRSGIPYTTINELHNGKNDINQCAVSTVWRLGAVIGVPPESLMNPIYYLNGVKGRYKGLWTRRYRYYRNCRMISEKAGRMKVVKIRKCISVFCCKDVGAFLNL